MILYCYDGRMTWTSWLLLLITVNFARDSPTVYRAAGLNSTSSPKAKLSTSTIVTKSFTATNITEPVNGSNVTASVKRSNIVTASVQGSNVTDNEFNLSTSYIESNLNKSDSESNGMFFEKSPSTTPTYEISEITPKRIPAYNGSWVTWEAWDCLGCQKTRFRGCRLPADAAPYLISCNTIDFEQIEDIEFCCRQPNGGWSRWEEWHCSDNCTEKWMIQTRKCNNSTTYNRGRYCDGISVRHKYSSKCQMICPQECPIGRWGMNCVFSCTNCVLDCDKLTGKCGNCMAGFQFPHMSCNKSCGSNTYGAECQGNCLEKCEGSDCIERYMGICPPQRGPLYWLWTLCPVVMIPMTLLFIFKYRNNEQIDERMVIDRIAHALSKTNTGQASLTQPNSRLLSSQVSKRDMKRKLSLESHYDRIASRGSAVD